MEEITIRISDIKDFSAGVITYTLSDDLEHYIDLERCRKNWVDHVNSSGSYMDQNGNKAVISMDDSRYIGTSDTIYEERCVIFYEDVHVRLLIGQNINKEDKIFLEEFFRKLLQEQYLVFDNT